MIVVRYQSFAANAVRVHRFHRSVAVPPKGDGNCELVKVERFASPLSASFTSRSFSGTRDKSRILNLFGPFQAARRSVSRTLLKYPQKSLSGLRVGFSRLLGFVGFHANQPKRRHKVWRTQIKGI